MKAVQAKELIRRKAEKLGLKIGIDRTPRKDYEIIRNFLNRIERELKVFTKRKQEYFNDIFRARGGDDNERMCYDVEKRIEDLRILLSSIRKVR